MFVVLYTVLNLYQVKNKCIVRTKFFTLLYNGRAHYKFCVLNFRLGPGMECFLRFIARVAEEIFIAPPELGYYCREE